MKNIKIVLSALVITLFSSCQDAIDITQPGELPSGNTFTSVDDLDKGILGVYPAMSIISDISFNSIWTDEVALGFANGGQGLNDGTYGFIMNTNSGDATAIWSGNYRLINYANRIIAAGENLLLTETDDSKKQRINNDIAQAKAMRAYGHFRLFSYFSPNMADDNALGVIKVDHVPTLSEHLPRSTNGVIVKFINEDLDFAAQYLNDLGDRTRISPDFIKALRARMAVYREDYATAAQYAQQLIDTYPLSDAGSYVSIWSDAKDIAVDEVIFKLVHVKGDPGIGSIWASVDATINGSPFFGASADLYDLIHTTGDKDNQGLDIRYTAFIGADSNPDYVNNHGKIVITKYKGDDNRGSFVNDEKIFRVSEMYFIMAECRAAAGDLAGVASYLQQINDARFIFDPKPQIPVPSNVKAAWAEILKQRRIEFAYEGQRYLDLRRLAVKGAVNIHRSPYDCAVNGACFLAAGDFRFTLPIPNSEIAGNPAIKGQQNPGYNK